VAKSPPFHGSYGIGTKARYSSGAPHWAYDYLTPYGTPLLAVRDGIILDCHSGEDPNSPEHNYSGEPSNWILLGYRNLLNQKRTVYYQHLSSVKVTKGQTVHAGDVIGKSGNSGNSTGPHLHLAAMKGWQTRATRYVYMGSLALRIYPPSLVWAKTSL
jgi:murein DD-endopeptidase MepM/ murein hydrolase activator NlpD